MKVLLVVGLSLFGASGRSAMAQSEFQTADAAHPRTVTLVNGQKTNLVGDGADMGPGTDTFKAPDIKPAMAKAQAASAPALTTIAQTFDMEAMAAKGRAMLDEVRKGSGSKSAPLETYVDGNTQLSARVKDGGGELHKQWSDFLFCVDGEGTEMTGGTMVEPTEAPGGETRGKTLEGAVAHPLHKGVMIHIPAGTNHQQLVAPGKYLIVFVIKVKEPNS